MPRRRLELNCGRGRTSYDPQHFTQAGFIMSSESTIRLLAVFGIIIGLAGAGAGGTAIYYQMKGKE